MDKVTEKHTERTEQVEDYPINNKEAIAGLDASHQPAYHDAYTKSVLRKVDLRLLPMLTLLYIISFLDRSNIGNAKVAGMNATLGLTGTQYNLALTCFFFPYAIFEVPSNIILKLIRPSLWIMILVVSWGCVMLSQGFIQNFNGLIITRVMLGFCEAGFFPAATYLLTTWVQTRLAVFFSAASLAGAFSGLLAFAIQNMNGISGLEGWRWIFILEGAFTVAIGLTLKWTLPDSPQTASFLSQEERDFIVHRLIEDAGTEKGTVRVGEKYQLNYLLSAVTEWKIWLAVVIYWANSISIYGFTFSAPSIILGLGYSAATAQLLTIPVYLLGVVSTVFFSWLSDKHQTRWVFIMGPYSIAVVGFIGLLVIPHPNLPGLTYAFLFCIPAGLYPGLITILTWVANNLAPSWKRAVGMAVLISVGNLGGAIGSNIYLSQQEPRYWLGYGLSLGIVLAGLVCTLILRAAYKSVNDQRDRMSEEEIRARYTDEQLLDLGDKSPYFRYVY